MSDRNPDGREMVNLPNCLDAEGRLTCPDCGCQHFEVYRVKPWVDGRKPRERECKNCGRIVFTKETVVVES